MKASWLLEAGIAGLVFYAGLRYVPFPGKISGCSMNPTIHDGDWAIINFVLPPRSIELGDLVVMAYNENNENKKFLKRIVAVEGRTVPLHCGVPYRLKEGEYWLEGDNKDESYDGRYFGPVPESKIIKKVIGVVCHHEEHPSP